MFRRLANRVNSAFASTTTEDDNNISYLTDMGFTLEESRNALQSTNGDITQAANLLLLSSSGTATSSRQNNTTYRQSPTTNIDNNNVDNDLQKALKESLDMHNNNNKKEQKNNNKKEVIDLTKNLRTSQKKKINLPPKLQDKSKEEQIKRCVSRIQPHPRAIDTLLIAFNAIKNNPSNQKYRSIDTSTQGYIDTLYNVPGVHDLLTCCKFYKTDARYLKLDRSTIDMALLWLVISTLQNATSSKEYIDGKRIITFHKSILQMLENNVYNPTNTRALSSEPDSTQNSTLIQLQLTDTITHKRRFHPDDTLNDIIIWIGTTLSSQISDKIVSSNEWILVDNNFSPPKPIVPMNNVMFRKTLQTLGWWPSARLQILMKDMLTENNELHHFDNERGLGVASS